MEELSRTAQLRALHTYLKKALKEKYAAIAAAHIANAEIAGLSSGTRGAEAGLSQLRRLAVPSTPLSLPDFGGGGGGSVVGQLPLLPPNAGGGRRRRIATSAITSANDGYVPFDERYDTGVPQVQQIPQVQQTQMPQNGGGGFQSVMQGIARGFGVAPRMQPQQQQYPMNAGPLPFQQQQPFQQPQQPPDIVPEQYVQHMQNLYAASRNPQMNPERFHEKLREAEQRYGHVPGAMDRLSKLGYIPHTGSPNAGPPDAAAYAGHMKNLYAAARDTSVSHDVFQKQLKAAQTKYGHLPNAKDRLSKLEAMRGRHTSSPTPGPNYAADMARLQAASTNPKLGHGDFHKLHQELQLKHRSNPAAAAAMQKAMQRRATLPGARQFASELAKKKTAGAGAGVKAGVKAGVPSRPLNYMADMKRLHAAASNQNSSSSTAPTHLPPPRCKKQCSAARRFRGPRTLHAPGQNSLRRNSLRRNSLQRNKLPGNASERARALPRRWPARNKVPGNASGRARALRRRWPARNSNASERSKAPKRSWFNAATSK